ncbi:hypothetical protein DL96DRAFT_1623663 [Flagelloscypha sp. PMI_526]|nr:hypothetical protein DL96DRAFT_1623663 [Flagelloscypha sp. PMI_526]
MHGMKLYSTAPQLTALGLDVLTEILNFVHDTSRPDIFSLLRINHALHNIALPFTVRECSLDFEADKIKSSHARIHLWLEPHSKEAWVLPHIRRLTVFGTPGEAGVQKELDVYFDKAQSEVPREEKWTPILRLIPFLPNLLHFTFACPRDQVSAVLLQTLEETHPKLIFDVKHWGIHDDRDICDITVDADDDALAASALFRNLEMDHEGGPSDVSYIVLQWIIAHSRQVDSVIVNPRIDPYPRTCGNAWNSGRRTKRRAETIFTLPPVLPKHKFHRLHLLPSPEEFTDFCIQVAESSYLEDLQCFFPLPSLVSLGTSLSLTELRHLKLQVGDEAVPSVVFHQLEELFKSCGPLETLSLSSPSSICRVLPTLVARHGPSLLSLQLFHMPLHHVKDPVIPSSVEDIALIQKHCSRLQELSLTGTRNQVFSDISNALGDFTSLSNLTLVFPEEPPVTDEYGSFYFIFDREARLEGEGISEWEKAVHSQLPVHSSFPVPIFEGIVAKGCKLGKLTMKLGDPEVRTTAQEFIVNRGIDGTTRVEAIGYVPPDDLDVRLVLDASASKRQRLRKLWDALLPNRSMPSALNDP